MPSETSLYDQLLASRAAETAAPRRRPRIRASAAVVPWRPRGGGGDGIEVFWVRRSPALRFMGGWHAFPGGTVDRGDAEVPFTGIPTGCTETSRHDPAPHLDEDERAALRPDLTVGLLAGAVRELFEETGILLAEPVPAAGPALEEDRRALLAGDIAFAELVAARGWRLDVSRLVFAGRWLTPPFAPMGFDNRFFLLRWGRDRPLQPTVIPGELDAGGWISPAEALARWRAGEVLMAPPILHLLRVLESASGDGMKRALARLRDTRDADLGPFRSIELRPGIVMLPLVTPTLPPATHTNAFLLGGEHAVLVDPATPYADEQARLIAALEVARARGVRLAALWLTHHHRDHTGAVACLRERFGVPVLAHPEAAAPLAAQGIVLDGHLEDGQRHALGGAVPLTVRVMHTPGHTRGHLSLLDERTATVLCGDLVSALSTIVIDPPEGDMDAYLGSLERVAALEPTLLLPAHGPPIADPRARLRWYRDHRLEREAEVLAAWRAGTRDAEAMVDGIYPDLAPPLRPVARRQLEAHLIRLRRRGALDPTG